MGFNTSVIVMNDALNDIKYDRNFGSRLADAIMKLSRNNHVDVPAGHHVNAATAIETHHASGTSVVAFNGNRGIILAPNLFTHGDEAEEVLILKKLADKLGYRVSKKPQR